MVTDQRVSADVEQLARGRMWAVLVHRVMYDRSVEAQEYLEPFLSPAEYRSGVSSLIFLSMRGLGEAL